MLLSLLLVLLGGLYTLSAQNRTVSGQVLDAKDQPLVGVAVLVDNTSRGTTTSDKGTFTLDVATGDVILKVSYLGYITQKVAVPSTQKVVTIHLQEDAIQLEETVVIGYGTQKRVNLTGAVSTVGGKELENRVAHSVTNMLQGSVAGLNITTSSGKPGTTASLNIRGVNSINSVSPLVLVDGVVGDLNRVNPNDVEQISVIKDASAAAVYGARAAFGVILVTTKTGSAKDGKATVRYSGRFGWEEPTASTDYENRGYWSVYEVNRFWQVENGGAKYIQYNDHDMQQLLARVNDKKENPDRPWVVEEVRNGRKQWVYYGNYDWYDMLFRNKRPVQQHSISLSGGTKDIKYLVSGAYDRQAGMQRAVPDIYNKYNLRSKIDFRVNKWATLSNNTSFFSSNYTSQGDGGIDNTLLYGSVHALACYPMQNPDGSWLYTSAYQTYKVANGRHILLNEGTHRNVDRRSDFSNTTRLVITPVKTLSITGDFTYRLYQERNTSRSSPFYYRIYPDSDLATYDTGAGENQLDEEVNTRNYYSTNVYATYDETFGEAHHLSGTIGFNYETWASKNVSAWGRDLASTTLDDLNLVGQNENGQTETGVGGGQNEYALMGFFGRINYDYKGRYLFEVSGRYDGSSRFDKDNRWGWFPSASVGWRISEEPFFSQAKNVVDNLKIRASFGSLGNQNVSSYYTYLRLVSINNFKAYTFGESNTLGKYSSLGAPVASDLTWETAQQWDLGIDASLFGNRFTLTGDLYIRDTKDMLTDGIALPSVYGADSPQMNTADMRTKGYELTVGWRDQFKLAGHPFEYSIGFNISDYKSVITKYDNPEKSFAKSYYVGKVIGEIWGFKTDGFFKTDEEAKAYAKTVDLSYSSSRLTGGWLAGDLKFLDLNNDGVWGIGKNTVDDPGDRVKLGNSRPTLSYGINASIRWCGFDASVFFQGTGNHYWYPNGQTMNFWGCYSASYLSFMPKDFHGKVWDEENTTAYFPRPRAYSATGGYLSKVNDHYLQNIRYLRLKNLTFGYTIPSRITKKASIDQIRVYFSGENLCYWSPLLKNTKYVDPEAAINRSTAESNRVYYPWPKTFMFGIDITF
jgi:TonB-linked SusC/RagA family outer membrane protein